LASADVGLSLLPDDDWSRGKCGLKVLQYLAAGLPVVGNSVGVTAEMINGAGIIADSLNQWIAAMAQLRNPIHRRELAAVGRQRVAKDFSVAAGLNRWLGMISEGTAQRRAG
jgi:glycosyltransferase involved in cell wall biosynthesis